MKVDNRWVVPHNPYLSRKYNAHINVEICGSIKAVKYLRKYIYKGTDQAMIRITSQEGVLAGGVARDEVTQHLECHYVSPAEAVVRIFEFHTHGEYPPVYRPPPELLKPILKPMPWPRLRLP